MTPVTEFLWFAEHAWSGLWNSRPISLAVLGLLFVGVSGDLLRRKLAASRDLLVLSIPLVGTILILLCAVLFRKQETMAFLPYLGLAIVLLLSGFTVWRVRRIWMTAVGVSALILWYSVWCGLLAVMSITDNWL